MPAIYIRKRTVVRPNANPPDVLSFSAIIESTKIMKIHRGGRVYTKATVANEL